MKTQNFKYLLIKIKRLNIIYCKDKNINEFLHADIDSYLITIIIKLFPFFKIKKLNNKFIFFIFILVKNLMF